MTNEHGNPLSVDPINLLAVVDAIERDDYRWHRKFTTNEVAEGIAFAKRLGVLVEAPAPTRPQSTIPTQPNLKGGLDK